MCSALDPCLGKQTTGRLNSQDRNMIKAVAFCKSQDKKLKCIYTTFPPFINGVCNRFYISSTSSSRLFSALSLEEERDWVSPGMDLNPSHQCVGQKHFYQNDFYLQRDLMFIFSAEDAALVKIASVCMDLFLIEMKAGSDSICNLLANNIFSIHV